MRAMTAPPLLLALALLAGCDDLIPETYDHPPCPVPVVTPDTLPAVTASLDLLPATEGLDAETKVLATFSRPLPAELPLSFYYFDPQSGPNVAQVCPDDDDARCEDAFTLILPTGTQSFSVRTPLADDGVFAPYRGSISFEIATPFDSCFVAVDRLPFAFSVEEPAAEGGNWVGSIGGSAYLHAIDDDGDASIGFTAPAAGTLDPAHYDENRLPLRFSGAPVAEWSSQVILADVTGELADSTPIAKTVRVTSAGELRFTLADLPAELRAAARLTYTLVPTADYTISGEPAYVVTVARP